MRRPAQAAFTLIELMIVVAIIGILAAIAIPKFADLIRKSSEGAEKGNLGSLRSALGIYYGDMEGQYPGDLTALTTNGKYLASIPFSTVPNYHRATQSQQIFSVSSVVSDFGSWLYDDVPTDPNVGQVWINCSHTDTKGTTWTSY
jgi:prepilin-type N-terminal cleavage/methylation domain-containing protein